MKDNIHPTYSDVAVTCACGNTFETRASLPGNNEVLKLDVCDACHPFYTGEQRTLDSAGRIQKFYDRYQGLQENKDEEGAA